MEENTVEIKKEPNRKELLKLINNCLDVIKEQKNVSIKLLELRTSLEREANSYTWEKFYRLSLVANMPDGDIAFTPLLLKRVVVNMLAKGQIETGKFIIRNIWHSYKRELAKRDDNNKLRVKLKQSGYNGICAQVDDERFDKLKDKLQDKLYTKKEVDDLLDIFQKMTSGEDDDAWLEGNHIWHI